MKRKSAAAKRRNPFRFSCKTGARCIHMRKRPLLSSRLSFFQVQEKRKFLSLFRQMKMNKKLRQKELCFLSGENQIAKPPLSIEIDKLKRGRHISRQPSLP